MAELNLSRENLLKRLGQDAKMKTYHARYNKRKWAEIKVARSMKDELQAPEVRAEEVNN